MVDCSRPPLHSVAERGQAFTVDRAEGAQHTRSFQCPDERTVGQLSRVLTTDPVLSARQEESVHPTLSSRLGDLREIEGPPAGVGKRPGPILLLCLAGHLFAVHQLPGDRAQLIREGPLGADRKSTRLNSSHVAISYAVFCLKKTTQNA